MSATQMSFESAISILSSGYRTAIVQLDHKLVTKVCNRQSRSLWAWILGTDHVEVYEVPASTVLLDVDTRTITCHPRYALSYCTTLRDRGFVCQLNIDLADVFTFLEDYEVFHEQRAQKLRDTLGPKIGLNKMGTSENEGLH